MQLFISLAALQVTQPDVHHEMCAHNLQSNLVPIEK